MERTKLITINNKALVQTKPLNAAVLNHKPETGCLDCGQHRQRGLQHELYEFVGSR